MAEAKVKSYTRKTKSGKTIQVRAHSRKCEGGSCADKKGAGDELAKKMKNYSSKSYKLLLKSGKSEKAFNDWANHVKKEREFYEGLSKKHQRVYSKKHGYTHYTDADIENERKHQKFKR